MKRYFFKVFRVLRGIVSLAFFMVNTIFWCLFFYPLIVLKFILPENGGRAQVKSAMSWLAEMWIFSNNFYIRTFLPIDLRASLPHNLSREKSYLVIANHRSWVDIIAIQFALTGEVPFLIFFIKDVLKYVPFLGVAWVALDYPFMKRYSKEEIKIDPRRKLVDVAAAQKSCLALKGRPTSVLIFLEGTRFTETKRESTHSKYQHLLPPKVRGASSVLDILGEQMTSLLDVTLHYPKGKKSIWAMMKGDIHHIDIEVKEYSIADRFRGTAIEGDSNLKIEFDQWINEIWHNKDKRITELSKLALEESLHRNDRILFFDGVCSLCNGAVDFLMKRDSVHRLQFASLQGQTAQSFLKPDDISSLNTIVYLRRGYKLKESTAVILAIYDLQGLWSLFLILILIPSFLRNFIYRFIAKNRLAWFGTRESCRLPGPKEVDRILP